MKIGKATVTPEEFVKAWQTAKSSQACADNLKIKKSHAGMVAYRLRKKGVPLKKFTSGPIDEIDDYSKLAELALSLAEPDKEHKT